MAKTINILLYGLIAFAPVAFGTIDTWALFLLEATSFAALFLCLIYKWQAQQPFLKVPGIVPLSLMLSWILLQLVPLPFWLVTILSPNTAGLYALTSLGDGTHPSFIPLTLTPQQTLQEFFRFASYTAIYILVLQCVASVKQLNRLLATMLGVGVGVSLLGIIHHYTGTNRLLWFRELYEHGVIFATFAYKNHFAGLVAMLLPLTLALFFYYRTKRSSFNATIRQSIVCFVTSSTARYQLYILVTLVTLVLALLLSKSRGGVICAACSCTLFLVLGRRHVSLKKILPLLLLFPLIFFTGIGKDSLRTVDQRFGKALLQDGKTLTGRTTFWRDALPLVKAFPFIGTGLGSFYSVYPVYKKIPTQANPQHAHNDYLELLTDTGIVGFVFMTWFLFVVFRDSWNQYRRRRDRYFRHIYIGAMTGSLALLLHSMVELQFRIAASVGLFFFVLLAIQVVVVRLTRQGSAAKHLPTTPIKASVQYTGVALVVILFLATFVVQGGTLWAGHFFPEKSRELPKLAKVGYEKTSRLAAVEQLQFNTQMLPKDVAHILQKAASAAFFAPLNATYYFYKGQAEKQLQHPEAALKNYQKALRLRPAEALYYNYAATAFNRLDNKQQAQACHAAAIRLDPTNLQYQLSYIRWLLNKGDKTDALQLLSSMLEIFPQKSRNILQSFLDQGGALIEIAPTLPLAVLPYLNYASLVEESGDLPAAEAVYDSLVVLLGQQETGGLKAHFFMRPFHFYMGQHHQQKALNTIRLAVERLPNNYTLRMQCGALYVKEGLLHLARAQYQQALKINPHDKHAQIMLDATTQS